MGDKTLSERVMDLEHLASLHAATISSLSATISSLKESLARQPEVKIIHAAEPTRNGIRWQRAKAKG